MRETAEDRRESEAVTNARQRMGVLAETVGIHHPEYATGLNQLALLLIMQGDPVGAEPLLRQALQIRRETLGERHPDFATNLSSLGGLLWARGDLDQAEPLLRQAVEVRCEALGAHHPKSIVSVNSLEQLLKAKRERGSEPAAKATSPAPETMAQPSVTPVPTTPALISKPTLPVSEALPPVVVAAATASRAGPMVGEQLAARLERLQREFARLETRVTQAGEGLCRGIFPAGDELATALASGRDAFQRLCRDAVEAARVHSLLGPTPGFESLAAIGAFLPALRAAESALVEAQASRRDALTILDRVAGIACPNDPAFAPPCHEQARGLRQTIEAAKPAEVPEAARLLKEGGHPLVALIQLLSSDASTGDSQWADWYDVVVEAYGNPLAVAAARCRLVLNTS